MTTVKVKAHMRNGKKVKGYSYTRGTVKAKRKTTKEKASSKPLSKADHLSEMRRIVKEIHKNGHKMSKTALYKLRRQGTYHGVKAGKINLI